MKQDLLCGQRLAQKIEKMLVEFNQKVGLVDDNGNTIERTESEKNLLASEASSTVFRREQNRNDNKD